MHRMISNRILSLNFLTVHAMCRSPSYVLQARAHSSCRQITVPGSSPYYTRFILTYHTCPSKATGPPNSTEHGRGVLHYVYILVPSASFISLAVHECMYSLQAPHRPRAFEMQQSRLHRRLSSLARDCNCEK